MKLNLKTHLWLSATIVLVALSGIGLHLFSPAVAATQQVPSNATYREISWRELMPKSFDPAKSLNGLDFSQMDDGDPRAWLALKAMKLAWENAPAEPSMEGAHVILSGFIIPLDAEREDVKQLLLVPYFGACIHTPPPPANQIVHVVLDKPAKGLRIMNHIKVRGVLRLEKSEADVGLGISRSTYRMQAELIADKRK